MTTKTSLKDLERNMFRDSIQDGIIDIQIGCVLLMFVFPLFVSEYLGDFWSSVVFLPLWIAIIFGFRILRKKVIQPRVGTMQYGTYRKKRLMGLNLVILLVNLLALVLGFLSFFQFANLPGWVHTARISVILLVGFSLAGYMLEFPRLYLYGVLVAAAPVIGEYLYQNHGASHHGFPITFGALSIGLILTGVVILIRILQKYPAPDQEIM